MFLTLLNPPKTKLIQNFNHARANTVAHVSGIISCTNKTFKAIIVNAENNIRTPKNITKTITIAAMSEPKDKLFFIVFLIFKVTVYHIYIIVVKTP